MKLIFIYILIFSMLMILAVVLDLLQGLGIYELIEGFRKTAQQLTSESYVTIVIFFLPLFFLKKIRP